ncbi:MAG: glycosyltransferase [Candidatus Dadabacteria bacterium]|nr:MAG: glycosyltransferase [Candidatus Dadabacteria bacterium]
MIISGATLESQAGVFAHIVTYNSERWVRVAIKSLLEQEGYSVGSNLFISITDNASSDNTANVVREFLRAGISFRCNSENLGYCTAHNQGAADFINSGCRYLLILNPDIRLKRDMLVKFVNTLASDDRAGIGTPLLFRADDKLEPVEPRRIDAAGMILTNSLRHFDRGSEQLFEQHLYQLPCYVFGATGACLLIKRDCVNDLIVDDPEGQEDLYKVFPVLRTNANRVQLFDEAFFAYREDADLSWRAQHFGWKVLFIPEAIGFHRRLVLPGNRSTLPAELNRHSVRNRFLLQINNYRFRDIPLAFIAGLLLRNFLVIAAVLFKERSSISAFRDLWHLKRRAFRRRELIMAKHALIKPMGFVRTTDDINKL